MWVKEIMAFSEVQVSIYNEFGSVNYTEKSQKKIKPAKKLFYAILNYAISDYINGLKHSTYNEDFRTAKNWLFNDTHDSQPTLDVVCEILNVDKAPLRRAVIRKANYVKENRSFGRHSRRR